MLESRMSSAFSTVFLGAVTALLGACGSDDTKAAQAAAASGQPGGSGGVGGMGSGGGGSGGSAGTPCALGSTWSLVDDFVFSSGEPSNPGSDRGGPPGRALRGRRREEGHLPRAASQERRTAARRWTSLDAVDPADMWPIGASGIVVDPCGVVYLIGAARPAPVSGRLALVRKSDDGGTSFTTLDAVPYDDGPCNTGSIARASSGALYAAGSCDATGWIVRRGDDDGASWSTVFDVRARRRTSRAFGRHVRGLDWTSVRVGPGAGRDRLQPLDRSQRRPRRHVDDRRRFPIHDGRARLGRSARRGRGALRARRSRPGASAEFRRLPLGGSHRGSGDRRVVDRRRLFALRRVNRRGARPLRGSERLVARPRLDRRCLGANVGRRAAVRRSWRELAGRRHVQLRRRQDHFHGGGDERSRGQCLRHAPRGRRRRQRPLARAQAGLQPLNFGQYWHTVAPCSHCCPAKQSASLWHWKKQKPPSQAVPGGQSEVFHRGTCTCRFHSRRSDSTYAVGAVVADAAARTDQAFAVAWISATQLDVAIAVPHVGSAAAAHHQHDGNERRKDGDEGASGSKISSVQ